MTAFHPAEHFFKNASGILAARCTSCTGKGRKRQKMGLTTLCYLEKDDRYLMLHRIKKEVDVNKDKWIGVGGHFEKDETPEECLLREVKEETGLTLTSWRFRGLVTFLSDAWETEYMLSLIHISEPTRP